MAGEPEILLPLQPAMITVQPAPSLVLHYFIETQVQASSAA